MEQFLIEEIYKTIEENEMTIHDVGQLLARSGYSVEYIRPYENYNGMKDYIQNNNSNETVDETLIEESV